MEKGIISSKNVRQNTKVWKGLRSDSDKVPIDPIKLAKYVRGSPVKLDNVKVKIQKKKIAHREKQIQFSSEQAARSEVLLTEESGFLEPDVGEVSTQFNQTEIQGSVDPSSAAKRFDLVLNDFGPYRMNYSKNGRYLLLGGRKGHVAAVDWMSKKLLCEVNVMESVHDVTWLHQETMFAVAQRNWVYFYDNQGIELHCIKKLNDVFKLMFLPYHFLLATVSNSNFISWLDISIGQMVQQFRIPSHGSVSSVAQSPANALICIGQSSGIVSLWSPNSKKPAITKWCHKQPISSIAFDPRGLVFATAGMERSLKLWDARSLNGPLEEYHLRSTPQCLSFSHRGVLATATGNMIEIYKEKFVQAKTEKTVYLRHKMAKTIPAELITFDTQQLQKVHTPSLVEIIEEKKRQLHIKPPDVQFTPKKKSGKQGGATSAIKRKQIMKDEHKRKHVRLMKDMQESISDTVATDADTVSDGPVSVLDRFKAKTKKSHKKMT